MEAQETQYVDESTKWVPMIDSYIEPDTWQIGGKLLPCLWDKADFYIESGRMIDCKYAIKIVEVFNRERLRRGAWWRRVKIEWVRDGEPNEYSRGWMISNKIGREIQPLPKKEEWR